MTVLSIILWVPALIVKALIYPLCIIAVSLTMPFGRKWVPKIFRNDEEHNRPFTWWEMCIRNNADGWKKMLKHPEKYVEAGTTEPGPTYHDKSFAWRWRRAGLLSSFRMVWLYPKRKHYGELYIGWKIDSEPPDLDFASSPRLWAEVGN